MTFKNPTMERKKQWIRILFAGLCIFLFFQTALILFLGEPWPSISFPRFAGPGSQTQTFTVTQPVLTAHFDDGGEEGVPIDRFLSMVPGSHHTTVLGENYRPVSAPAKEENKQGEVGGQAWEDQIKEWAASTIRSPRLEAAPARTPEGKRWTKKRLKALFPGRSPIRFVVEWQEVEYARSGDDLVEEGRSLTDKISIDL